MDCFANKCDIKILERGVCINMIDDVLREKQKKYPKDNGFEMVCKWLESGPPLGEEEKNLICNVFKGEPFQGFLYNTIIWNMPNTEYRTIVETAAQLYDLQRNLNKKIGRTCYGKIVKDETLMRHVYNEIIQRFGKVCEYDCGFEDDVMELYLKKYVVTTKEAKTPEEMYKACADYRLLHPSANITELLEFMRNITPIKETIAEEVTYMDYFIECLKRNEPKNNPKNSNICRPYQYRTLLEMHSGDWSEGKLPKEKDVLYILCIGLGLSNSDFQILRAALAREYQDSTKFADNTFSYRDEKIQSVLRDIDTWYENVRMKYKNPLIEMVPQKVLLEVDKMLIENGYEALYEPKRIKKQK